MVLVLSLTSKNIAPKLIIRILRTITRNSYLRDNFILAEKCYVSVKYFSESRVSLDIPPINATLKLNIVLYVTRQESSIGLAGFVQPRFSLPGPIHQPDFILD